MIFRITRGRTFGTLLVDLQSHQVLDVLPDRKAETAATWMKSHPEIRLVSRDRGGDYAAAAQTSAPQAIQCADRFHLMTNLSKSVEGIKAKVQLTQERQRKLTHPLAGPILCVFQTSGGTSDKEWYHQYDT
jgi:transposase